jgi:hypothetical protein
MCTPTPSRPKPAPLPAAAPAPTEAPAEKVEPGPQLKSRLAAFGGSNTGLLRSLRIPLNLPS